MPAIENAAVRRVLGGGFTEEPGADRDEGEDPVKWAGAAGAYFREKQERRLGAEGRDSRVRRTIYVDTGAIAAELDSEDTIEFTVEGVAGLQVGKVSAVAPSRFGPLAGSGVETTAIELEPRSEA